MRLAPGFFAPARKSDAVVTSGDRPVPQLPVDRAALVIGVTGTPGVSADCDETVAAATSALLEEFVRRCPSTPIVMMTSLSTHLEIVACEVAAERGLPLLAVLSEPAETHVQACTPEDAVRCAALLERCARVTVMSPPDASLARYEAAMHVAHYSHLVVALFDGDPKGQGAELNDIINVRLHGIADRKALAYIAYMPDVGPIYQIEPSKPFDSTVTSAQYRTHYPEDYSGAGPEKDFESALRSLDAYNADLRLASGSGEVKTMRGLFERTDETAGRLQSTTFRFLFLLYSVAIVATAVQYLTVQWLKYLALAGAFVAYAWARARDYENRFQDYRVVSEGLRVQIAWKNAGLGDQVEQCYLGRQQADLQWIRMALRYLYLAFETEEVAATGVSGAGVTSWISEQRSYFDEKPRQLGRSIGSIHRNVRVLFGTALATTVVTAVILYLPDVPTMFSQIALLRSDGIAGAVASLWAHVPFLQLTWAAKLDPDAKAILGRLSTASLTIYAAVALLVSNYCDKRAFTQNMKRYDRMAVVFRRAQKRIKELGDRADAPEGERVLRELGREALIENADWLLNRRERPFSFVS